MFQKKVSVTLLDKNWAVLTTIKLLAVPRHMELIYINSVGQYYQVIHAPIHHHYDDKTQVIYLVVEEYTQPNTIK